MRINCDFYSAVFVTLSVQFKKTVYNSVTDDPKIYKRQTFHSSTAMRDN